MSDQLSFSERVRLNDEMSSLKEQPLVRLEGVHAQPNLDEIVLPDNLRENEQELLNRFDDPTLSDLAYEQWSEELVEAVAVGALNIKKGDWIQLFTGEMAKVQDIARGLVMAKRKTGAIKKIRVTRLSRIGKHQGKPAFGFLSPKQD